jgi:hypothetical protein
MFHVQLLLTNTSATDYIDGLSAELLLPDGLSFASMLASAENQNNPVQTIDHVPEQSDVVIDWYVRGDVEGMYNLSAVVTGTYMPNPEDFTITFTTQTPFKVWAGSALHLHIEAGRWAYKGLEYTMNFRLENVSDKELYNVSLNIFGGEFLKAFAVRNLQYNGIGTGLSGVWNDGTGAITRAVFAPGDTMEGTFKIVFDANIIETNVLYMLRRAFVRTMAGSTTEIPVTITFFENLMLGNVTGSGTITLMDVLTIYQHMRGVRLMSSEQFRAGDIDGSGEIEMMDVLRTYYYSIGRITSLNP